MQWEQPVGSQNDSPYTDDHVGFVADRRRHLCSAHNNGASRTPPNGVTVWDR